MATCDFRNCCSKCCHLHPGDPAYCCDEKKPTQPPAPKQPEWKVGDEVMTPAKELGVVVHIDGLHAWVNCPLSQHIWPLTSLARPAPKKRTVTVQEWKDHNGNKQWSEQQPEMYWVGQYTAYTWKATDNIHTFEVDDT